MDKNINGDNMLNELKEIIKKGIFEVVTNLGYVDETVIKNKEDIILEIPKEKEHGDYSTNTAMRLAKIAKKRPLEIANEIVSRLDWKKLNLSNVEIAGPGFINLTIDKAYLLKIILKINEEKENYEILTLVKMKKFA